MNGRITGLERSVYDAYPKRAKAEYAEYEKAKQEYDPKLPEQQQSNMKKPHLAMVEPQWLMRLKEVPRRSG